MSEITMLGIDVAKRVFQLHAEDAQGRVQLRRQVRREQLLSVIGQLPRCQVVMEACAGSHHWTRQIGALGHEVKLIPAQYVKAFNRGQKNDRNDAQAIVAAGRHRHMPQVAVKSVEQQAQIEELARVSEACQRLMRHRGVGPLIASAYCAEIGDAHTFKNGRQVAAWLGLVPRQYSSGERHRLFGITKRGNSYLRRLLIHGARAALRTAGRHSDAVSRWSVALQQRRGSNRATVALANKTARHLWAQLRYAA